MIFSSDDGGAALCHPVVVRDVGLSVSIKFKYNGIVPPPLSTKFGPVYRLA